MASDKLIAEFVNKKNKFVEKQLIDSVELIEGNSPSMHELKKKVKSEVYNYPNGQSKESFYWGKLLLFSIKYGFDQEKKKFFLKKC